MMKMLLSTALLIILLSMVSADLPVHCEYEQVQGAWTFFLSAPEFDRDSAQDACHLSKPFNNQTQVNLQLGSLQDPTSVMDDKGHRGYFTMIYDQGMEITLSGKKYFAFFHYTQNGNDVVSNCGMTFTGSYHDDDGPQSGNWGCVKAYKANGGQKNVFKITKPLQAVKYEKDTSLTKKLNEVSTSATFTDYPQFEGKTYAEIFRSVGNVVSKPRAAAIRAHRRRNKNLMQTKLRATNFPQSVDWTNVNGTNYVSPVENQASCGSCYIFGSLGEVEDRLRIQSKGQNNFILSKQEVLDCRSNAWPQPKGAGQPSLYNQGCEGGFPYLVAKTGQDYGFTHRSCYGDYYASEESCKKVSCDKPQVYVSDYKYIGGYYGAHGIADLMAESVATRGPLTIGFEVTRPFMRYRGGVFRCSELKDILKQERESPIFEQVNHAVRIVGYGVENGVAYWRVQNSWGSSWGEGGLFKIERGVDCLGFESDAVAMTIQRL